MSVNIAKHIKYKINKKPLLIPLECSILSIFEKIK